MTGGARADGLERVRRSLGDRGLLERLRVFDEGATRTSVDAAAALGCAPAQIVKSLVFAGDAGAVLVLVAGDRRGDAAAIAAAAGCDRVRLADPATVHDATGYDVGGVSPFDLPRSLPVLVDESLLRFGEIWAAGGTSASMVRLTPAELLDLTGGTAAPVAGCAG